MRRAVFIVPVAVAAAIIGWLYWQQGRPQPLIVSGFIEAEEIRVGSRVGGRVKDVTVSEGSRVRPGEPLFTMDPFDLEQRLTEVKAELAADQANHERLKAGYRPEEIAQARASRDRAGAVLAKAEAGPREREIEIAREELNVAKANLELAESEHVRLLALNERNEAAKTEVDRALRELKASGAEVAAAQQRLALLTEGTRAEDIAEARAVLAEAQQKLNLLENGYRAEDVAQAAAQVAGAQAKVAAIEVQMSELTVVSPCDCTIEAIDLRPGDLVAPNVPTLALLDLSAMWVRAYVPESRLRQVQLGQRVPVLVTSFPDERFAGRVTFIAREAEFTPRNIQTPEERSKQVFRVKVTIEEGLDRLRAGMAADVRFEETVAP